jgi:hypothetical protein
MKAPPRRPPVEVFDRGSELVDAFLSVGPAESTAFGDQPLTWSTLHYWQRETETFLEPGELEDLVTMSYAYLSAVDEYREKVLPSPYSPPGANVDRPAVNSQLKRALDAMISRPSHAAARPKIRVDKTTRRGG